MKKENLLKTYLSTFDDWVERTALSSCSKSLLDLTFCTFFVREMLFLSGKNQEILKSNICGNHVFIS